MSRFRIGFGFAVLAIAGSCTGIFQRARPLSPQHYEVRVVAPLSRADGSLRVGSAERDITPAVGGYLAGFSLGRTSTTVASPLRVRVLVYELAGHAFAVVGIDNLGLLREDVDWIKGGIAGLANGDVFVCASHTHAGPDLLGLWGYYMLTSGRDRAYLAAVRQAVAEAVGEARGRAVAADLVQSTALLPPQGLVKNSNRSEVFDRRFVVLQARARDDGRPVGTLLHLACHPEVLPRRNTEISSDFVGSLCDNWQARGQGQAVFVNGALGAMISPGISSRDMDGVAAFGREACDLAERSLAQAKQVPVDAIEVRRRDLFVPVEAIGFRMGRLTTALPRELYEGDARTTVGFLRIGTFAAAAIPGEMEPALAEQLRAEVGLPNLVVFGLCDDELGYLMREKEARDPEYAYERSMSVCLQAGEMVRQALTGVRTSRR